MQTQQEQMTQEEQQIQQETQMQEQVLEQEQPKSSQEQGDQLEDSKMKEALEKLLQKLEEQTQQQQLQQIQQGEQEQTKGFDLDNINWEELYENPREFVKTLISVVGQIYAYPVIERLETMRVQQEINYCKAKYDDFDQYVQDIYNIGMKNPNLTVEQAYFLAKGMKSVKREKEQVKPKTGNVAPQKPVIGGEKSGINRSNVKDAPKDLQGAVSKAYAEVFGRVA